MIIVNYFPTKKWQCCCKYRQVSLTIKPSAWLIKLLTVHGWHVGQKNEKARILIKAFQLAVKLATTIIVILLQSNGYHKRFWRRKAELFWRGSRPVLLTRQSYCNTWPADIYRSFKPFSVHCESSWKCFVPSRSTQRLFTASSIQTLAS